MDDVIFEEFKGTGNMELVLDRSLSEKRIFPAVNVAKSGTRRDDLLLTKKERDFSYIIKSRLQSNNPEHIEELIRMFVNTEDNKTLINKTQN